MEFTVNSKKITSRKPIGSLLIANPVSRVLLRYNLRATGMYVRATYTEREIRGLDS